ncbi:MAG: hypothetical protein KR126chlam3_00763 [Chlamydiae bacterium]|nr:hypothetical protein [Chlamydiota bacterium]
MKQITVNDLEKLSIGSAILGSGGGGDPSYPLLMVKNAIEKYGPIDVISIEDLKENDLVIPLSFMGAPLINTERLQSGSELEAILQTIEKRLGQKPTVLMPAEIGGANAFTPLLIAAKRRIPVLDADMIGRAFPELQMSSCYLRELSATPAVMADCMGNTIILETRDANTLERMARAITVAMGSSSAVGFYFMSGSDVAGSVIPNTLSQALALGEIVIKAREESTDPISALVEASNGRILGRGTLIDIDQSIEKGFLQGSASILCEGEKMKLFFQNEFLLAKKGEDILSSTPELLVLLEENSGTPITSEALRYGLQVALIAIPAPEIWQTPEGLELVGPQVFGYEPIQGEAIL